MEKILSRREFLSRTVTENELTDKKALPGDPIFQKYANREMPFANARTNSGLSTYAGVWTEAEALHLSRRLTFGSTKESIDLLEQMSLSQAVDFLIDNPQMPTSYPLNIYQNVYPDTQGCPFNESWVYFNAPDNNDGVLNQYRINYSFKPWWIGLMMNQPTHILEKITLFWANHFSTQTEDFNTPKAIWQHFNTIRTYGLGNFRTLLKSITVDPHMLAFLNGNLNTSSAPDENYAREMQELFTVGKGPGSGYTEDDIKQAAKILTGWRRGSRPDGFYYSFFNDTEHDTSDKHFSAFYGNRVIPGRGGSDGQFETDDLIDMMLDTDEAAKYICRCLYRWFVYYVIGDAEEANVIAPLAQIFRNNNYEIVPVLKALFTSEHFFDPVNRGCIIKSPVDLYMGLRREFNIQLPVDPIEQYSHWQHFKDRCEEAGQNLADPPNVSGWPAYYQVPVFYQIWINSDTLKKRNNSLGTYATLNGFPVGSSAFPIKIDAVDYVKKFPNPEDARAVVTNFCSQLLPQTVSAAQTSAMVDILLKGGQDHYWTDAWNAYISNPSNEINEGIVRVRLTDLVHYIICMEEYQLC